MRIFGRIMYATFMVGLFLLAFTYSRDLIRNKYLEEVFMDPVTNESSEYPKYYYFYTAVPDYHNSEALFTIEMDDYEVTGYEIITADVDDLGHLTTEEYIYFIVYSDTKDLSVIEKITFKNDESLNYIDVRLDRYQRLNILIGVNEEGYVYVPKTSILNDNNFNKIKLIDRDGLEIISQDFAINENQFIAKEFVQTFYEENNRLPVVEDFVGLSQSQVLPNLTHVAEGYEYIFTYAMISYFVILIASTYLIFFRKKKNDYTY